MGCTTADVRRAMVRALEAGMTTVEVAGLFGTSRQTVSKWWNRRKRYGIREGLKRRSSRPRTVRRKVTRWVRAAILLLREAFRWGTQRIRVALRAPPPYIEHLLQDVLGRPWKAVELSRQRINLVLREHGMNGSPYGAREVWNHFEASRPNEMWQVDIKEAFRLEHEKRHALVAVDDHSRYLVACAFLDGLKTADVLAVLRGAVDRHGPPAKVLVDNGTQFKRTFEAACGELGIEVEHTPPHYPQSKGKVERTIRTFNEEYLRLQEAFESVEALLPEFVDWYNHKRYHMGIDGVPGERYLA
jgi:transposase InsO family protein